MTTNFVWDPPEVLRPRNHRLIAERLGHPAGSVETCEQVEGMFPGALTVRWLPACTIPGFEGPAGFYATHPREPIVQQWQKRAAYGATQDELIAALEKGLPKERRKW